MLKVASMIAIIFNLNGDLLTTFLYHTQLKYCIILYSLIKCLSVCLSVCLSYSQKDAEVNKERENLESVKRKVEHQLKEMENELDIQRQELTTG